MQLNQNILKGKGIFIMYTEVCYEAVEAIPISGGSSYRNLWNQEKKISKFYNYDVDDQGSVPGRSVEAIEKELGLN